MKKTKENSKQSRELFTGIALLGPANFLEELIPKEKLSEYAHFTKDNARSFLLLKLLTEVQKVGFKMGQWNEYLEKNIDVKGDNTEAQILDAMIDEQSLWQRKLAEGLVLLINFSETNRSEFYHHFLLIQERQYYEQMLREQQDFFERENEITKRTIDHLSEKIASEEDNISNMSHCWYLTSKKRVAGKRGNQLNSFKDQLLIALEKAKKREKLALGYIYSNTYGETSSNIHFSALKKEYNDLLERFHFGFAQCGLLITAILIRAHSLTNMKPKGINESVVSSFSKENNSGNALKIGLELGDFALVGGAYLAEILENNSGKYGYENYLVKYLIDSPIEGIKKAWFSADHVSPYIKRNELEHDLKLKIQKEHDQVEPPFSENEIQDAIYESVIFAWENGLGEYFKRETKPRKIGDRGIGYKD